MKCNIQNCSGNYEHKHVIHTVKYKGQVLVFENVPAEVCDLCSDTLLTPETLRHIEKIIQEHTQPKKHAPVYEYA